MKILALKLILLLPFVFFSRLHSAPDEYVRLTGKVTVTKESETWIKASVPFGIIGHPKAQTYSRSKPTGLDDVVNLEFMNNIKVKIYLCFSNEFKKKALRSANLSDAQFYQYYSSEIEFKTIKVDRTTKYANFMFPSAIAEKDEFGGGYITPVGYAIEIVMEGVPMDISNAIVFEKYRDEATLLKFKQQAEEKSSINEGVMLPAHHVFSTYFQKGAYLKPSAIGN